MTNTNWRTDGIGTTRRTFLKTAAAAGVIAGFGGVASAQAQTFRFEGRIPGWFATSPADLAGQTNPTLNLEPGQQYQVVWTNADGTPHNFVIIDGNGEQVVRTEVVSTQGETQTVEFTASEEMAEYFCEIHPGTMRGRVVVGPAEGPQVGETPGIPRGATVGVEQVASGMTSPSVFAVADEDADRRFVADQTGAIYVHGPDGLEEEPFLDLSDSLVDLGIPDLGGYDERGLIGLAFHPEFQDNRRFFAHYSAPRREGTPEEYDHTAVLSEFTATEDLSAGDPESERVLLEVPQPQDNHNGGAIAFGPDDGYLYVALGDGGAFNDVGEGHVEDWYDENEGGNGQDVTENLLGSILRIDVDGEASATPGEGDDETTGDQADDQPYAIPEDNPLVGTDSPAEQWAWGFRNPYTMSFNDGQLFVADAGQNLWEEVSIVEAGGNYGWNVKEGTRCFSTENPVEAPDECPDTAPDESPYDGQELIDPIIEYRHRESTEAFIDGSVVIAGHVYDGDAIPDLQGKYVFGNWSGSGIITPDGEIFAATPADEGLWSLEELVVEGEENGRLNRYVYAFGRDADGQLYVLTNETGKPEGDSGAVFRIVPPSGEGTPTETETETTEAETETTETTETETPTTEGTETTTTETAVTTETTATEAGAGGGGADY